MDVGIACAADHAVVAIEQEIAVETVGPGLHREQETGQRRAVGNRGRRHRSVVNVVFDVAARPIDRSGEQHAHDDREQHPVLDRDIGGQREEIEADVLAVERIVGAVRHVIEELQEDAPVAGFRRADQRCEQARGERDEPRPGQSIAQERQRIGRRRIPRQPRRRRGDRRGRRRPGEMRRKQAVGSEDHGRRRKNDDKRDRLGADRRQEHRQITDRGEPQPVDQDIARVPEQDQADSADEGCNDQPGQGARPWCVRSGSGDPDRHDPTIAKTGNADRRIRGRQCGKSTAFGS